MKAFIHVGYLCSLRSNLLTVVLYANHLNSTYLQMAASTSANSLPHMWHKRSSTTAIEMYSLHCVPFLNHYQFVDPRCAALHTVAG